MSVNDCLELSLRSGPGPPKPPRPPTRHTDIHIHAAAVYHVTIFKCIIC